MSTEKKKFAGISRAAFEHPADRAALTALRKIPGFDLALKKIIGLLGEKSLRTIYLSSSVRVGERQFTRLFEIYKECIEILDIPQAPELYVSLAPFVNAGAVGTERPFVVINSATLEILDEDEIRFIIGHELGHILADHVLYKTMLMLLLRISVTGFGIPLTWLALTAIIAGLNEWDRKSELSSDRAGLLCVQDPGKAYGVFMKMAGGTRLEQMDIETFLQQAEEYQSGGDRLDSVYKILNLMGQRHPFPVLRVWDLKRWAESDEYRKIMDGDYPKRTEDDKASIYKEMVESARSYREAYEKSADPLIQFVKDMGRTMEEKGSALFQAIQSRFSSKDKEETEAGTEAKTDPDPE